MEKSFSHPFPKVRTFLNYSIGGAILAGLYLTIHVNYLLFHSLVEIFSIVVAFSLFMLAWNSRRYIENQYVLFIGIGYLFIGVIDLLHTLSYKGTSIFTDYDYYANQLWIGARYMESITLLLAFYFLKTGRMVKPFREFTVYTVVTGLLLASIFYWRIFPECFIDGVGLTPFKKISEYIICAILLLNIYLLKLNRQKFEHGVYWLIFWSLICTVLSELAFTFYVSNYGFSNIVGHYFKLISFFLIYRAIIQTGIVKPYQLIFRDLKKANDSLQDEIKTRIMYEQEREKLIESLRKALDEIKTLKGILPLCSFCKKIRNKNGEWEQVDMYIHKHSQADISHSVCPQCMREHYPEVKLHSK
jgi:hypothetical protein